VPDKTWKPATISLTYSVSVAKDVPFKITRSWGTNTQTLYLVHDYLAFHRASFLKCVRDYIQGKSLVLVGDTRPLIDYPIDDRAWVGGHKLAQEQLEKLEKDVGKEKLIQRLKDEGYGAEARESGLLEQTQYYVIVPPGIVSDIILDFSQWGMGFKAV
jgi:hypothetical protein